jgi:fatty acid desaturase
MVDTPRVDDRDERIREAMRRRARRLGFAFVGLGAFTALIFWSLYGALVGAVTVAGGLYMAFAYLPLAGWIRQLEERRDSAP